MLLSKNVRVLRKIQPCIQNIAGTQSQRKYGSPASVPLTESLDSSLVSHGKPAQHEIKSTTLENGVKVISVDGDSTTSQVSVFVQAGSRYEDASNLGITHVLRNAAFLTNQHKSTLGMVRELQQSGASLEVTCSRDHFVYSGSCIRDSLEDVLANIAGAVRGPLFEHWEVADAHNMCHWDRANMNIYHQNSLLDCLHGAAYRNGLGNSVICPEHIKYSGSQLRDYVKSNFVGQRMTVVAVGCDHDSLVRSISPMIGNLPAGAAAQQNKQKYFSGEGRINNSCRLTHAALVAEGASHQSQDLLALGLLQHAMGANPFIKWGSNTVSSRLNRAAMNAAENPFMVTSLNISHSDSGLFGFYAITEPKDSSKVLKSVLSEFKNVSNGKISDENYHARKINLKLVY